MTNVRALGVSKIVGFDNLDGAVDIVRFNRVIAAEHNAIDAQRFHRAADLCFGPTRRRGVEGESWPAAFELIAHPKIIVATKDALLHKAEASAKMRTDKTQARKPIQQIREKNAQHCNRGVVGPSIAGKQIVVSERQSLVWRGRDIFQRLAGRVENDW